jgi:hypothetical protein
MTAMIGMPHIEAYNVIDAMEQAEKAGDLEALKWCARRLVWLYEQGEVYDSDKCCNAERFFNNTYADMLKRDPPPKSIAGLIAREPAQEPPAAEDAEKALDTVKAFFEESLGGKSFKAACASLDALREALRDAIARGIV